MVEETGKIPEMKKCLDLPASIHRESFDNGTFKGM